MVEHRWLSDLAAQDRSAACELYARAFEDSLLLVAPGPSSWSAYISLSLNANRTLVAIHDGAAIGAITYSPPGKRQALQIQPTNLIRLHGLWRGALAVIVLTYEFLAPLPFGAGRIPYIELLAVDAAHRGRGTARGLINELVRQLGASAYSIQVDGDNSTGLSLYRSLGFSEAGRIKEPWPAARRAGTMERVFMRLNMESAAAQGEIGVETRAGTAGN